MMLITTVTTMMKMNRTVKSSSLSVTPSSPPASCEGGRRKDGKSLGVGRPRRRRQSRRDRRRLLNFHLKQKKNKCDEAYSTTICGSCTCVQCTVKAEEEEERTQVHTIQNPPYSQEEEERIRPKEPSVAKLQSNDDDDDVSCDERLSSDSSHSRGSCHGAENRPIISHHDPHTYDDDSTGSISIAVMMNDDDDYDDDDRSCYTISTSNRTKDKSPNTTSVSDNHSTNNHKNDDMARHEGHTGNNDSHNNKVVTFSPRANVRRTVHKRDMTIQEEENYWYSDSELKRLKREAQLNELLFMDGIDLDEFDTLLEDMS